MPARAPYAPNATNAPWRESNASSTPQDASMVRNYECRQDRGGFFIFLLGRRYGAVRAAAWAAA